MNSTKITYKYNCVDKSVLLQPFKKYYVSLFYPLIPKKITANFITIISSMFMWVMFYLSVFDTLVKPMMLAGIFALLLNFYVIGDHLDGMHAKNTETSSPLGEFLDHYFDIFNTAIFLFSYFALLQVNNLFYFSMLIWLSFVAVAATMVEELERGELYFGPIGTLEAIFITIAFFISCLIPDVLQFWKTGLVIGIPSYWILIAACIAGMVATTGDIILRLKKFPLPFAIFVFTGLALCISFDVFKAEILEAWWVIALYSADYIGRVMRNYLLGLKNQPYPDRLVTIYVIAALILKTFNLLPTEIIDVGKIIFLIYLAARAVTSFSRSIFYMREYWQWFNN